MVWASAIQVGGSLLGGALGSRSAKKSARKLSESINRATEESKRQFGITDKQFSPYRDVGSNALSGYQSLSDPQSQLSYLEDHPLYSHLNKQVLDSTRDRMIAGGKSYSGQGAKTVQSGLYDLSEGLINNAFNRYGNLVDMGLNATARTEGARQALSNNLSNLALQQGNVGAAGVMGSSNAWGNSVNQLSKLAGAGGFDRLFSRKPAGVGDSGIFSGVKY
jgi:hypothetical protein